MTKRFGGVKQIVESLLAAYPETRESDKALYKRYAQNCLGVTATTPFLQVVDDHELNYDSIGRSRRWFQAQGKYESTKQIQKRREAAETDYKDSFGRQQ